MRCRAPSSREALAFAPARDGAKSRCDIVLDISGIAPLFAAPDLRDGYLRADPGNPAAVLRAVLKARDLVGTFDKPRYIAFTRIFARIRARSIVGCRRCLDLCPAGAIAPGRRSCRIDAAICAGCGECAAACPTGAAAYALPPVDALMRKLRALLTAYREAGGTQSDPAPCTTTTMAAQLIDALARHGAGLPANVLPLGVNEVTQIGLETIAAAFAYGASAVRLLLRAKPRHDLAGLRQTIALATAILDALGFGSAGDHRDRRSRRARRGVALHRGARRAVAAAGEFRARRRKARSAAADAARIASGGADAGRRHRLAGGRAIRRGRARYRRLHAVPRLRLRLPDRRARRRSRAAAAAFCRGCLRAVRAVQGNLSGEGDQP